MPRRVQVILPLSRSSDEASTLLSILYLSAGDRSNGLGWGRRLLLVYRGIWKHGTPQRLSFRSY